MHVYGDSFYLVEAITNCFKKIVYIRLLSFSTLRESKIDYKTAPRMFRLRFTRRETIYNEI